jgi:glycosyltransferase involved in cell wall biosynthesis
MAVLHIDHVLSTRLLRNSAIFDDLIRRAALAAPAGARVTRSFRPSRNATVRHYHRPTLERRLLSRSLMTVHHDLSDPAPWLAVDQVVARCREVPVVHCLNRSQAAVLAARDIRHTCVIPHGVDRRIFRPPACPHQWWGGKLRLGLLSRRHADGVKGEALLAALLAHLDPSRVAFVMVGEGRWREAELARGNGFAAEHFERVPYRLMAAVIARIDALLICSRREGGPASLPEALGSGLPVFATAVGMCPDFIRDGDNGLLLAGEPRRDGERIMSLLADHGRGIAALQRGAFAGLGAIPSWDDVIAQWYRVYAEIAAVT